jgi:hypothetical protein
MKNFKYIPLFILFTVSFYACKKDTYVAQFDKSPQERMNEQMTMVKNTLIGATNGWIATLPTGLGGGYGFYMSFDADEFVNMYADLTDNSATTAQKTQYRIRQDMGTALSFDTYNYISILNNPEPSAFGGTIREGFRSDIDFIFDRASGDSLVFIGKRYRQKFTLVKATAAQKTKYTNGDYKTAIDLVKKFFTDNPNAYIELDNAQKVSVEPNGGNSLNAGKRLTLTAILANDAIVSASAKFAYTIDKMAILDSGLKFNGITFDRIAWKDANTLAMYDAGGKEYIIKNSPTPLLPLYKLWGSKYNGMLSNFKSIYPGTSTKGAEILDFFHQNMENGYTGFRFNFGRINFVWNTINKRLTLNGFSSQNGGSSGWTTSVIYNYTVDASGAYKFTLNSNFSGGYVSTAMIPLHQFLLNNTVRFDYFVDGANVYGLMKSVTDPTIEMTFVLQ